MPDSSPDKRVYEQIEKAADFHQPAVYELLSFYHGLQLESEPLDGQFIPLTTVQPWEQSNTLIFAVGILPPSAKVTGRLLDRSASIQGLLGEVTATSEEVDALEIEEVRDEVTGLSRSTVPPTGRWQRISAQRQATLHESIQPLADRLKEAAAREGISIIVTQGLRSVAQQDQLYAKGRTTPGPIVTGVRGGDSWHNFGLAFDVALVSPGPKPPKGTPNASPGKDEWSVVGRLGQELGLVWGGTFSNLYDPGHFEYHPGITKAQARAGERPAVPVGSTSPLGDTANSNGKWALNGSQNANKASKTAAQIAGKDLNRTNLGREFQAQQAATILATQAALDQMANTPPLRLLINPQSFRRSFEKVVSDGNWGRNGNIIEHWGDNQDTIEGSGKIAAFYSLDALEGNGPGLTRTARQFSASYQNLLSLFLLYKNNGGVWFPDPISRSSKARNLSLVGSVYLYYDHTLYIGSFDTFSLTESETSPFTLEYSFAFTVRASFLLDHLDDPQYTYGQPADRAPVVPTTTASNAPAFTGGYNEQPSPDVAQPPSDDLLVGDDDFNPLAVVG